MPAGKIEADIIDLENQYWQAMQTGDIDSATALTDFPCLIAGASGVARVDREQYVGMMQGADWKLNNFEITDTNVRLLGQDVAVIAYKIHENLVVKGEQISMEANESSTWVQRDGRWLCAMHTESIPGDPYGRPQKAKSA